jgi:hypothetical protein
MKWHQQSNIQRIATLLSLCCLKIYAKENGFELNLIELQNCLHYIKESYHSMSFQSFLFLNSKVYNFSYHVIFIASKTSHGQTQAGNKALLSCSDGCVSCMHRPILMDKISTTKSIQLHAKHLQFTVAKFQWQV